VAHHIEHIIAYYTAGVAIVGFVVGFPVGRLSKRSRKA